MTSTQLYIERPFASDAGHYECRDRNRIGTVYKVFDVQFQHNPDNSNTSIKIRNEDEQVNSFEWILWVLLIILVIYIVVGIGSFVINTQKRVVRSI